MFLRLRKYLYLLQVRAYAPKAVYEQAQGWLKIFRLWMEEKEASPPQLQEQHCSSGFTVTPLPIYHFGRKFYPFALQLPKPTLLEVPHEFGLRPKNQSDISEQLLHLEILSLNNVILYKLPS